MNGLNVLWNVMEYMYGQRRQIDWLLFWIGMSSNSTSFNAAQYILEKTGLL